MCMQTNFGCKIIDGKKETKKKKPVKKENKKTIHQSKVEFE